MKLLYHWSVSRLTVGICAALLFAVFGLVGYSILLDYRETRDQAYRDTQNLAKLMSEHALQTMAATDQALLGILNQLDTARLNDPAYRPFVHRILRERLPLQPNIYAFYIVDAAGRLRHSSTAEQVDGIDFSDRNVFHRLRDMPGTAMAIGTTAVGRIDHAKNRWIISMGRRLEDPKGRFAGALIAVMALGTFQNTYDLIRLGTHGTIGLLRTDGRLIAGTPFNPELFAFDFSRLPVFSELLPKSPAGTFETPAAVDGLRRFAAYQKVPGRNLVVFVGLAERDVFAHWRQESIQLAVLAAIMMAVAIGLSALAFRIVRGWQRDSKRNEERLAAMAAAAEQGRQDIEAIFRTMSDAFYTLDDAFRFTYLNPRAERILGSGGELIGRMLWDAFPDARDTVAWTELHTVMTQRRPREFEVFYPPFEAWFEVRAFPHKAGLAVYFRDVTKRHEMEEQLRQAQKMDAIGQLTGGIAHDFNNLLTVILGNTDLLASRLDGSEPLARVAVLARDAAEKAAELTQRLLAFARRQTLDPGVIDVNQTLLALQPLLQHSLGAQITINLDCGEKLWPALVDPGQFETAILNLAINARDAMPQGGRLDIETGQLTMSEAAARQIREMQPGDYVTVTVSDTGTGMPREVAARVFEPFFTTKELGKGSGLGLPMVYGFVKQSGGHVQLQSEPGIGTTVTLYLPRARAEAPAADAAAAPAAHPSPAPRGSERILLVEDDEMVRRHTVALLSGLGYVVTAVAMAAEGLDAFARQSFDLVVSDIILPGGMNGREMALHMLQDKPSQKILHISGYAENGILDDREGVHLLWKPFRNHDLAAKLREILDGDAAVRPAVTDRDTDR
ncbi:MAG TPA: ATP-binding protein [Ferrovibrio sp.]|uniref:ATP-binding protein n=1 Tax=Ferrovibrio sp. TaxID=1917215 RepID=UPI002ED550D7